MIGKTFSHYKILEKIGEGGMGEVYLAQDTKLDRKVAIKFLPQHLTSDKDNVERFEREAKAAASLNHPNIVTIHEIAQHDDKTFIVMEYLEGNTLREVLTDNRQLSSANCVDIISQICSGLQEAHKASIVHRDIKPENIIIGEDGRVRLLDFGLAKLKGVSKLTRETTTLGTIQYMSPEQIRGEDVDIRSDIWSLGIVLYEILTGKTPFKGEYTEAVYYAILNEEPEALSADIANNIRNAIRKCLNKNPDDRYDDIIGLVNDLQFINDNPTDINLTKDSSKTRLTYTTVLVSAIVLLILGYLFSPFGDVDSSRSGQPEWENSIAILPFEDMSPDRDQEWFCEGMMEQVSSNLGRLRNLKVIARQSVMKYKNSDKTIPEIGKELNVAYVLESSIRKFGNRIRITAQLINTNDNFHVWSQDYDKEYQDFIDVQDQVSEAIASNLLDKITGSEAKAIKTDRPENIQAYEYYLQGKYDHKRFHDLRKTDDFSTAEKLLKAAINLDQKFAAAYAELADLYNTYYYSYYSIKKTREGRDKYMRLQEAYLDTAMQLDPNSAEVYHAKCWIHTSKDEIDEAFKSAKKALKLNRNYGDAYGALASLLSRWGLHNLSIKYWSTAIEINPLNFIPYIHRAYAYDSMGEYDKAEMDLQKAIELEPDSRKALWDYSIQLITSRKLDKAKPMVEKFKKLYPDSKGNYFLQAALYAVNGESEKALSVNLNNKFRKFLIFGLLKMKEEAIQYLTEQFDIVKNGKNSWYLFMKNNRFYHFLHFDPRFQEILTQHKELYEENLAKYGDIDL